MDLLGPTILKFVFGVVITEGRNVLQIHLNGISWSFICTADTQKYFPFFCCPNLKT